MKIEMRPMDSIRPYPGNPRVNDSAIDAVVASIREFGWRQPIVTDNEDVIVVGHTRHKAAKKMGLTEVPVHVATDLTPAQAKAYRLADNQTGSLAEWDKLLLPAELSELKADGFDLDLLGFDPDELTRWMSGDLNDGLVDPDDVPALPENPITQPGELWLLGDHRLLCGDSTNADDVTRLLAGAIPFLMTTDPPYGVNYDPEWRHRSGLNDSDRIGKVANDDRADWTATYKLFPGTVAYVWHGGIHSGEVANHLRDAGFEIRTQVIWNKNRLVISRGHYHWKHEPCWYAVRPGLKGGSKWVGDRSQSTVWDIAQRDDTGDTTHSCQKPVECMGRPISHHGSKGDDVYDPFLGSGTTLIAAEQRGRRCFAMELDPRYVDAAVTRWEKFTGKKAERVTENTPASAEVSSGGQA
jgi:DNA modification methylase